MFIEQSIEFNWGAPAPPGCTYNPKTGYFHDKTKISKENKSSNKILLTAKYIAESNIPRFPSNYQIYPKFKS